MLDFKSQQKVISGFLANARIPHLHKHKAVNEQHPFPFDANGPSGISHKLRIHLAEKSVIVRVQKASTNLCASFFSRFFE